jgi:hypothetical protein
MGEKVVTLMMCLFSVIAYGIATTIPPPFVQTPLVLTIVFVASAIHLVRLFFRKKEVEEYLAGEAEEARKKEEEETGEREMLPLFLFGTLGQSILSSILLVLDLSVLLWQHPFLWRSSCTSPVSARNS